jgi:hypothetical protein
MSFDPYGIASQCFPVRFARQVRSRRISWQDYRHLQQFKAEIRHFVRSINPVAPLAAELRARHKRLVLLPLEIRLPWIQAETGCHSMTEYFHYAMSQLPKDVGVIMTQHPNEKVFATPQEAAAMRERYPNLIHIPELERYFSASLFLFEYVDAIASLSSSVRLQGALIWDKPLITRSFLGINNHLKNSFPYERSRSALNAWPTTQNNVLDWFVRYYSIPWEYSTNPDFTAPYFQKILNSYRASGLTFDMLPPIGSLQEMTSYTLRTLDAKSIINPQ